MRLVALSMLLASSALLSGISSGDDLDGDTVSEGLNRAVMLAREGELAASLQLFASLRDAHPEHQQLLYDETVVLLWAGKDRRAIANANAVDPVAAPHYVVSAVAKALRNGGDFDGAAEWYAALIERDGDDPDAWAGLAMSYADAREFDEAARVLAAMPEGEGQDLRRAITEGYVYAAQGRALDSVAAYDRAISADPGNRDALRGKALALRSLLLPRQALALADEYPGLLSDDEVRQLEADVVALQVRYESQAIYPQERRYEGIDRALGALEARLARRDLDPDVARRLRLDYIVALGDRRRTGEAVEAFEALSEGDSEFPAYLLASAATSYLQERRPERARQLLELAVAKAPNNLEYRYRLFFAYADLQEHDRAIALTESLLERLPPARSEPGSRVVKGSEDYLRASILRGLAAAYSDRLAQSQAHFEGLLADMPNNREVRRELANVYRWRGWPDRSLQQYQQVLAVDPDLTAARIGRAHVRLDRRDYELAEAEVDELSRHYPEEPAVRMLEERWEIYQKPELQVDARSGNSSGETFGQDQYTVDAAWFSNPFAYRYRAYVQTHDAYSEFPEGETSRRRLGVGIEYAYRRWLARAGLSASRDGGDVGLRSRIGYRYSDTITLSGRLATRSNATPLRGERVGVSSTAAGVDIDYSPHESASLGASLTVVDLSDGNRTVSARVTGARRLVNRPAYKLTGLGEVGASRARRDDVAYYSPRRSSGWMLGLSNDHTLHRRYDLTVSHGLTGRAGLYDQDGYSAATAWDVEYLVRADIERRWRAYAGVSRSSRVYDGDREYATFFMAGMGARF